MQSQHIPDSDEEGEMGELFVTGWTKFDCIFICQVCEYNDGKGIQFSLTFTPLPPSPKAGMKCWANSKKKTTNIISIPSTKEQEIASSKYSLIHVYVWR